MPNSSNVTENIDERVLRLLGLQDVFDLDYDTYLLLLKEEMVKGRMPKSRIPTEEVEVLTSEYKRVKSKRGLGRFKVKKRKINTQSFGVAAVNVVTKKIKSEKLLPSKQQQLYLPPGKSVTGEISKTGSYLNDISKSIGNIIKILTTNLQVDKKNSEKRRIEKEKSKREGEESKLEKGLGLVKKAVSKVIAPVKNILSSIIDFLMKMFWARVTYKLLEWLADPKNQDKLKSVFRFLGDHWPKLLSLYIMFGTSFGKFARGLISIVVRGGALLARAAVALLAKAGIGKAGKLAGFLGGKYGKLAVAGVETAATVGATMALSGGIEKFTGIGGDKGETAKFAGGGFANFGSLFKGGSENMFGSLSDMFGFNKFRQQTQGLISGEKGVDKIPAMLSDGEFVMSRGAVRKYGVDTLESMNAAGGGTNKPKIVKGIPYAAGGGLIASKPTRVEAERESKSGLIKQNRSIGETSSTRGDFRKTYFEERLKRIESQLQVQKALASGRGINIKGSSFGIQSGRGFGATYGGRKSIVVPNAAMSGWEPEINIGGIRYFGQARGKDVVYSSNYAKGSSGQIDKYGAANKTYRGRGGGLVGGLGLNSKKDLPKTRIMSDDNGKIFVGHLRYRNGQPEYARAQQRESGILEKMANLLDPKGAKGREETLNARSMRMTSISDLQDYRKRGMEEKNIKKMMGARYNTASNDLKARELRIKNENQLSKTANYSSANIIAAQKVSRGVKPLNRKSSVVRTSSSKTKSPFMGSGLPNTPNTPKISASHPAGFRSKEATLGLMR
jgi:hypothetical protein